MDFDPETIRQFEPAGRERSAYADADTFAPASGTCIEALLAALGGAGDGARSAAGQAGLGRPRQRHAAAAGKTGMSEDRVNARLVALLQRWQTW
jgi:hypothetical protein